MATARIKNILAPGTSFKERLITNYKELKEIVQHLKKVGYKIVLTQGVYDLIHEGHALYLENARSHGDVLIVGVDSDALTRKRKGPGRPIVPQEERFKMLVHLRHVDIVTIRDVDHGIGDLIKLVSPDTLIVSESTGDFTKKQVKEYNKYCGRIVMLPPQATTSTTARIRNVAIEGVQKLVKEINVLTEQFLEKIKKG